MERSMRWAVAIIVGMSTPNRYRYRKKASKPSAGNRIVFQVIWNFLEAMLGYT